MFCYFMFKCYDKPHLHERYPLLQTPSLFKYGEWILRLWPSKYSFPPQMDFSLVNLAENPLLCPRLLLLNNTYILFFNEYMTSENGHGGIKVSCNQNVSNTCVISHYCGYEAVLVSQTFSNLQKVCMVEFQMIKL